MNFLAHIYLSGENEEVKLGNFFGDFIKGRQVQVYSQAIQAGIHLHRFIDRFTDSHEVVRKSKLRLRGEFRHYSPVIVDVFYDHFLAKNWRNYHRQDLIAYTEEFYKLALRHKQAFPEKAGYMLNYMAADNWLYGYRYTEGIRRALSSMARRTSFVSGMERAHLALEEHYAAFEAEFRLFFPQLVLASEQHLSELRNNFSF